MSPKISVPLVVANATRCLCPTKCPVQTASACVKGKVSKINDALKASPLKREDIPGVYCSSGKATCKDINTNQACQCGSCAVFAEFRLAGGKPVGYYCRDGSAK